MNEAERFQTDQNFQQKHFTVHFQILIIKSRS
jgi:hypothetical protein